MCFILPIHSRMINTFSMIRVYIPNKVASVPATIFVCLNRCLLGYIFTVR